MKNLTTEELKRIASEKNKKGIATSKALKAQKIIWDEYHRLEKEFEEL